jgi:hypothetical protein
MDKIYSKLSNYQKALFIFILGFSLIVFVFKSSSIRKVLSGSYSNNLLQTISILIGIYSVLLSQTYLLRFQQIIEEKDFTKLFLTKEMYLIIFSLIGIIMMAIGKIDTYLIIGYVIPIVIYYPFIVYLNIEDLMDKPIYYLPKEAIMLVTWALAMSVLTSIITIISSLLVKIVSFI